MRMAFSGAGLLGGEVVYVRTGLWIRWEGLREGDEGRCTVVDLFDLSFWCAFVLYADDAATLHGVGCHDPNLG